MPKILIFQFQKAKAQKVKKFCLVHNFKLMPEIIFKGQNQESI